MPLKPPQDDNGLDIEGVEWNGMEWNIDFWPKANRLGPIGSFSAILTFKFHVTEKCGWQEIRGALKHPINEFFIFLFFSVHLYISDTQ